MNQVTRKPRTLSGLARSLKDCERCPLCELGTTAVPGAGPPDARLVIVGEQPGDQEDLAGQPFVGPAGKLLDSVLREAGIERESVFVTNAVKRFKYVQRGQRRIHQKHPAYLLRLRDHGDKVRERKRFVDDLRTASNLAARSRA